MDFKACFASFFECMVLRKDDTTHDTLALLSVLISNTSEIADRRRTPSIYTCKVGKQCKNCIPSLNAFCMRAQQAYCPSTQTQSNAGLRAQLDLISSTRPTTDF
eukprot:1562224-Amphidinium_carterae.1